MSKTPKPPYKPVVILKDFNDAGYRKRVIVCISKALADRIKTECADMFASTNDRAVGDGRIFNAQIIDNYDIDDVTKYIESAGCEWDYEMHEAKITN